MEISRSIRSSMVIKQSNVAKHLNSILREIAPKKWLHYFWSNSMIISKQVLYPNQRHYQRRKLMKRPRQRKQRRMLRQLKLKEIRKLEMLMLMLLNQREIKMLQLQLIHPKPQSHLWTELKFLLFLTQKPPRLVSATKLTLLVLTQSNSSGSSRRPMPLSEYSSITCIDVLYRIHSD